MNDMMMAEKLHELAQSALIQEEKLESIEGNLSRLVGIAERVEKHAAECVESLKRIEHQLELVNVL